MVRGSGLKGLISFGKNTKYKDHRFKYFKTIIKLRKKRFSFISSNKVFSFFVKDPSNINEDYKRTRIRNLLHST